MFCKNCGTKVEEGWKVCLKCGVTLNNGRAEDVGQDNSCGSGKVVADSKNPKEVKEGLLNKAFSEDSGGVILAFGANSISKDMVKILEPEEEAMCFYHAEKLSVTRWLKGARAFRTYIVCTNQRFVYTERTKGVLRLFPFLTKTISVPYKEIQGVTAGKRVGIFSGKIELSSTMKKMCFAVTDSKSAAELQELLTVKSIGK